MNEDPYEWMDSLESLEMGPMYFDYDGNPIKLSQWTKLIEGKYMQAKGPWRVDETMVGPWWVSTVWIGMDMGFGPGPPIIYETMIFFQGDIEVDGEHVEFTDWGEEYTDRYATRAAAQAGHDRAVEYAKQMMRKPHAVD